MSRTPLRPVLALAATKGLKHWFGYGYVVRIRLRLAGGSIFGVKSLALRVSSKTRLGISRLVDLECLDPVPRGSPSYPNTCVNTLRPPLP